MPIDFKPERWEQVRETYRQWWAGELKRPIIPITLSNRDPGRPMPSAPLLTQATCADLSIPVEALVDRIDWELSRQTYLGDAYPNYHLDHFGPGIATAFMGAKLDNSTGLVWFHAPREIPITDLHLEYDPDNIWLIRIKELCAAMMKRWQGQVQVSMTDLGGNLDLLSTFRPADQLPMDLYDDPEHVQRVLWETHELWHRYFNEIHEVLRPINPGYSAWCEVFSDRPYYMLQCDFSYMISPDMFRQFVLPELEASTKRLDRSFYHLDGEGQLPHLDMILGIEKLDGVQWIPGCGAPRYDQWAEIYERIFAAGKKTWLRGTFAEFAPIHQMLQRTGLGKGVYFRAHPDGATETEIQRWLERFNQIQTGRMRE